jgi:PAS domain S-box-containing protein
MQSCLVGVAIIFMGVFATARTPVRDRLPPLLLLADQDYPPLSYRDGDAASGMDVEIARALSGKLGRDIRVVVMDWDLAQQKVLRGEADGLLSMSVSPDRQALFDFTDSTITHDFGIFVRRGGLANTGPVELSGKRIGVTPGGLPRRLLAPAHDLVLIRNYEDGFARLASGAIDAVAADRWVGAYTLERGGFRGIVATGPPFATLPGGIAVRKGQRALVDDLDAAVRVLKSDGTLEQIQERWRPKEMLFVSRQRVNRLVTLGAIVSLTAVCAAVALWAMTAARHSRARKALESNGIIARRQAEEALRRTETSYREVVENANDVIFTVDREGHCLSMNRAGREITGYVADDTRGIHLAKLVAPDYADFARQQLERVLDGEVVPTFELEIVSREGRRLTLELDVHALYSGGTRIGVQGIARDITVRKELEGQLRQAQKMEAIGRLAGGIAHDFNNLLTVIVGYSELVGAALGPDSPVHEDVCEIRRAASSAESLTRQLLIFSRKDVVQPAVLDLNEIVDRLDRMLRRIVGEDIHFIVRLAHDPARIKADAGQIEQVVMNLVVNARDAMPEGGSLTVETQAVLLDEAFVRKHSRSTAGAFVRLTVADTGHGMTPEVRAQIFTPFFTTKGPSTGTGLGLATVHGIVLQSGGWIDVESQVGTGTRFAIYFPRVTMEPAAGTQVSARTSVAVGVTGTILFVEDDDSIRALGARTLRNQGFTVLVARHAAEALQMAEDPNRRIDLLLTDIVMPGLSGRELAARLLQSRAGLKVLYTSGYNDDAVALRDVQVNGPGFIQKPYSSGELARHVRVLLGGT